MCIEPYNLLLILQALHVFTASGFFLSHHCVHGVFPFPSPPICPFCGQNPYTLRFLTVLVRWTVDWPFTDDRRLTLYLKRDNVSCRSRADTDKVGYLFTEFWGRNEGRPCEDVCLTSSCSRLHDMESLKQAGFHLLIVLLKVLTVCMKTQAWGPK